MIPLMQDLIERLDLPPHASYICVKPNLCEYRCKESGATSDPEVVDSILQALRRKYPDSRIRVIENDATGVSADRIFKFLGIDDVADRYDCEVVNVANEPWIRREVDGYLYTTVRIPQCVQDCDLFITHPKLKTHGGTKITCSLKNQFGLLKPKNKIPFHSHLDEAIVDSNLAALPHVSIVDANLCMEGNGGPTFGSPKHVGLMIGGRDIVSVDAFCARLAGFRPYFVGHIRKAATKRLGDMAHRVMQDGDPIRYSEYKFKFNRLLYYALKVVRGRVRQ
jgi:uncharacterized protein (DUF362 family)